MKRTIVSIALGFGLLVSTTASAGKGASYASLKSAIGTDNVDSILSEIERAEKLPCGSCIDLVRPLIDHPDVRVRDVAAWWLSKRAIRDQVRDEMYDRLGAGDSVAARNAAEVLGRFMHPEALMALEVAIHDGALAGEARAAAARAVATIGDYRGKAVLEAAVTSESADVRVAAAWGLRRIGGNRDGVALVELLADPEAAVVREAALTLGQVREESAVGGLLQVALDQDQDARVRRDAAWAIGKIGSEHGIDDGVREGLRAVAESSDSLLVRGAARMALQTAR